MAAITERYDITMIRPHFHFCSKVKAGSPSSERFCSSRPPGGFGADSGVLAMAAAAAAAGGGAAAAVAAVAAAAAPAAAAAAAAAAAPATTLRQPSLAHTAFT